ncbi:hypothetical protein [Virgibacillus halodenitrificans]|uniref:hypothetical protein n=1 Tax=Virgibacillus halodenitrificans TaxID=1482 RepID=UPI000EF555FC|nr:hypothetical protein [Virgibacillus halodenitrificans]
MSSSSLWLMDKEFNGVVSNEYRNSWWFSPIVWDVLLDKYMHDEIQTPYGYKKSLISVDGAELNGKLNKIINNCENFSDRICWEITNQQVFFTKDRQKIAEAIKEFAKNNTDYHIDKEGKSYLAFEHISARFNLIANDILAINEKLYPYFVFKNTSVDDNVEYWFENYNDKADEYENKTLKEWNEVITEFVIIFNRQMSFSTNIEYFNKG